MDLKRQNEEIEKCILDMRSGDKNAFERLYRCTEKYIYFCIMKEGLPKETIIDVMQEVYLAVYEGIDSLRDIHAALGWMKKIAFHKSMDYFRRQKKQNLLCEEDIVEKENADIPDMINMPEKIMEKRELQQMVQELIGKLDEEEQWLLKVHYFEECKIKEIAEQMEVPENTVKSKLLRARKRLKDLVEEMEQQQGIRLHSVQAAPVLLFLLELQAEAITVPSEISVAIKMWLKEELPQLAKVAQENLVAGETSSAGISYDVGGRLVLTVAQKWIAGGVILLLAGAVAVPNLLKDNDGKKVVVATTEAATVEQTEAVKTEQTEEAVLENRESELIAYYHKVFDEMRENHRWPEVINDYTSCEGEINVTDVENNLAYAVMDFNQDGEEELAVCVMHAKEDYPERQVAVYKYLTDIGKLKQIFGTTDSLNGEEAIINFYKDGKATILGGEASERPSIRLYAYDIAEKDYEWQAMVRYWDDTPESREMIDVFPKDIDVDKDGVVWRLEESNVPEGVSPYSVFDGEGYDEWKQNHINEENKIEFEWTLFSEGWKSRKSR